MASLTGRRAFAVGGYLLILVAPTVLSGLLTEAFPDADAIRLIELSVLPIVLAASLFPDTGDIPNSTASLAGAYAVVVLAAAALLLWRYRRGAGE